MRPSDDVPRTARHTRPATGTAPRGAGPTGPGRPVPLTGGGRPGDGEGRGAGGRPPVAGSGVPATRPAPEVPAPWSAPRTPQASGPGRATGPDGSDVPTTAIGAPGAAATSGPDPAAGPDPMAGPDPAAGPDPTLGTEGAGDSGRHRRSGPAAAGDSAVGPGSGRRGRKRKGSFWRELPLLIVVAIVLTFAIQTFVARIYVIPSASMEQTLHGCNGCRNDRVAVDKVTYRFSDPAPGDVVVFRGPASWRENEEVSGEQPSGNVLVRGFTEALSLVGLASPHEKDFVKRVIAVGGQTVACCDPANRVTVDGRPLAEPYVYLQPGTPSTQAPFEPVQVPAGQLWVMGDNRNNSADARFHGPIGVSDVIGKARVIVLPVNRWGGVPDTDPQAASSALGAPGWGSVAPAGAGLLLALPVVGLRRRARAGR